MCEGTRPELLEVQVTSKRWNPPGYSVRGTFSRHPFVTYPPLVLHVRWNLNSLIYGR